MHTPIFSPEVHADRTVTFRLSAPQAAAVDVDGEWERRVPMRKGADGVWSATVGPLGSDLYGYSFIVDGVAMPDPANPRSKPSRTMSTSVLDVPGEKPAPIEPVPGLARGTVHLHDYESKSLGRIRRLRVYTPPGWDAKSGTRHPVLYLLHGSGDNEAVWTEFGCAHTILDRLIAAQKTVPMMVVMTDGHASESSAAALRPENYEMFARDFLEDAMPFVEARYLMAADRSQRAIAGLSMGGNQALLIGLNRRDLFAWVAGMSSAIREPREPLAAFWSDPVSEKTPLRLLWLAIGREDFLLEENRAFHAMLTAEKVPHEYQETDGSHQWRVWRRYLAELAPRLFQDK